MGRLSKHKKHKAIDPNGKKSKGQLQNEIDSKKKIVDSAPTKKTNEGLSRKFRDMLMAQKKAEELQVDKKTYMQMKREQKSKNKNETDRLPGESDRDHALRLEKITQLKLAKSYKDTRKVTEKRKNYFKEKKEKEKQKKVKSQEIDEGDREFKKTEPVKFGEVAETVPTITALPRLPKKPKPQDLSKTAAAERRIMDMERDRIISNYRKLKEMKKERERLAAAHNNKNNNKSNNEEEE